MNKVIITELDESYILDWTRLWKEFWGQDSWCLRSHSVEMYSYKYLNWEDCKAYFINSELNNNIGYFGVQAKNINYCGATYKIVEFSDFIINTSNDEKINITFFLISKETQGVVKKTLNIYGNNCAGISQINFDNVQLDSKYILGSVGNGYLMMPRLLNHERMDISLYCRVAMKLGIKSTVEYLFDRKHDDISLINYPVIQHSMINIYQEYQLINNYIANTAKLLVEGKSCIKEVLISKINSTEIGRRILQELMQLEGANGYLQEVILGALYSDIAPLSSGGGSNNVLRNALFNNIKIGKGRIVW